MNVGRPGTRERLRGCEKIFVIFFDLTPSRSIGAVGAVCVGEQSAIPIREKVDSPSLVTCQSFDDVLKIVRVACTIVD
jgi:hypothetical protein